ncbi:MAG: chemotaxis protein CheX [Vicinamibacterales bacterium]
MSVRPEDLDLNEIVSFAWSTTLGLQVDPLADIPATFTVQPATQAQVHISGSFAGVVVLQATPALAALVAERMFMLGDQPPSLDELQDAFGEMANIIGGNVKGLLSDGGAHLSLPTVVQGHDFTVHVRGTRPLARGVGICAGQPLVVTLLTAASSGTGIPDSVEGAQADDPQTVH